MYAGSEILSGDAPTANWGLLTALFNGASSQLWLNGTSIMTGDAGSQNSDGLTIGNRYTGAFYWKGYLSTLAICDPSLSDAQRQDMQTAMNTYWAVY